MTDHCKTVCHSERSEESAVVFGFAALCPMRWIFKTAGPRPEADLREQEERQELEARSTHVTTGGTGIAEVGDGISSWPPGLAMNRPNMLLILC